MSRNIDEFQSKLIEKLKQTLPASVFLSTNNFNEGMRGTKRWDAPETISIKREHHVNINGLLQINIEEDSDLEHLAKGITCMSPKIVIYENKVY